MKSLWIAAFALSLFSSSLSYPQQAPSREVPANQPLPEAKAAAIPGTQVVLAAPINNETDLRRILAGKQLFLRGGWLSDDLHFDNTGKLASQSPKGSFTLCSIEIDRVHFTGRTVELEGIRYGIHFEEVANWSEQLSSFDRIRITPKKQHVVIVIDRQDVKAEKKKGDKEGKSASRNASASHPVASNSSAAPPDQSTTADAAASTPARAAQRLSDAINRILAPALDESMIASMPDYWQYFYRAQLDHKSIEPTDPNIARPGPGVDGPRLLRNLVALSNDYAQHSEVAGVAIYKVILDAAGKPLAVAVYRPIGFGLDENGVAAIQSSTFSPAYKDGKAVISVVNMDVNFRIYSDRTHPPQPGTVQQPDQSEADVSPVTGKASLPGLFSVQAGQATAATSPQPSQDSSQPPQPAPAQPQK